MLIQETKSNPETKAWERAYEEIRNMILTMKIKPGESVNESSLAEILHISRTPVREAMKQLEQEGLILTENGRKRVFVLQIKEINEIFELKTAIEGSLAFYAAQRKTTGQGLELAAIIEEIETKWLNRVFKNLTQDHQEINEWLKIDTRFHEIISVMAGNRKAVTIITQLNFQWHRFQLGVLAMEGRLERNIKEHVEIGKTVLSGDSEKSKKLMVEHLESLQHTITNIMEIFHFPI